MKSAYFDYLIPETTFILDRQFGYGESIAYDRSQAVRKVILASGAAVAAQLALAWLLYQVEYANIISVREYQHIEDVAHNRTTIALNRCLLDAAQNYLANWTRICRAYELEEGCGLPQDKYTLLAEGLKSDNATCQASHAYEPVSAALKSAGQLNSIGNIVR